jgi:hypothetical protein
MGKLVVKVDVLVKELASVECSGAVALPDGKPLKAKIVEVLPGIVSMVGEEINLCGGDVR